LLALSGLALVFLTFLSSGYLMGAVADEKANRTIEILVTTVAPRRLMSAKLLAVLAITATQLAVWIVASVSIGLLGRRWGVAWLRDVRVDPSSAAAIAAVLVPAYVQVAALMAALGAMLSSDHAAQHVTTLLMVLYLVPAMFALSMLQDLDHPLMVTFSLLPLAAPLVLPLRAALGVLPAGQAVASAAIQVLCALGAVWLAGRALRRGLLRYRRLRWHELLGRPPQDPTPLSDRQPPKTRFGVAEEPPRRARGKTWLILRHEFLTTVTKPLYILVCLALPLLVLAQLGVMVYANWTRDSGAGPSLEVDQASLVRLMSLLAMLLLYGMILMASGLMLRSVSEEKKNRVMEVLLLSVHPRQLLAGKTIALGLAGMLQAVAWVAIGCLFFALWGDRFTIPAGITLSAPVLAWSLVFALLGYALYACLYAGAGALLPDWRKSRQATLLIALPAFLGFQVGLLTTDNPHGPLAVAASLFPLTAPFVMVKRLVMVGLPPWQPPVAAGLLALSIPLIVRAVARVFHAQNLLSGQPFSAQRYLLALLGRE
jgi:ABC-type Na+ efflux pump permease subunit